jgi:signal transduction histidine kinase
MNLPADFNSKLYEQLEEANNIKFNDPKKASEIAKNVYLHSLKSGDDKLEAKSLYMLGVCSELQSNYTESMKYLNDAILLAKKFNDYEIIGNSLNCIGIIHDNLGNFSNALNVYFKALKIFEQLNQTKKAAIVLSNIGLIYTNIKDYKNALKYYSQALDIAEETSDEESIIVSTINIGLTHKLLGNYNESLKYIYEALEHAIKINDKRRISIALDNIAEVNLLLKNFDEALNLFDKSRLIKEELNDKKGLARIYAEIGNIFLNQNKYEEANKYLLHAIEITENLGLNKTLYEVYKLTSKVYECLNDYVNAYKYLQLGYKYETEYLKEEISIKTKNISTQIEIEKLQRESEIQRLKNIELVQALDDVKKLNLSLQELNNEKNQFMAIAVHDLKNPLQNILSTARIIRKTENLEKSQLNEFTNNIINQTERMFNIIKKLLDHNAIEQGELKLKKSLFDICALCYELINSFKESAQKKNINLIFNEINNDVIVNSDKDIVYEILQNLLSNAIKFTPLDKNVYLYLEDKPNSVDVSVADEGPGFTEEDKKKMFGKFAKLSAKPTGQEHSTGLGLSIVKKLCEMAEINLKLETSVGKGSKFTISLKK